jgi:hypothetical protein
LVSATRRLWKRQRCASERSIVSLVFGSLVVGLLAGSSDRPETVKADVGPIAVEVDCDRAVGTLADSFRVSVTMTAPQPVVIDWPTPPPENDQFRILEILTDGPDQIGRFSCRRWQIRIEPMQTGTIRLGSASIRYRDGIDAEFQTAHFTLPKIVVVRGPTSSSDPSTLRPIPDLPRTGGGWELPRLLRWLGAGLAGVAAVGYSVLALARRRHPADQTDPAQSALEVLRAIESGENHNRMQVTRVADALRGYMQRAYGVGASKQTTPELMHDPSVSRLLSPSRRAQLAEVLCVVDATRFSMREPDDAALRRCIQLAVAFLEAEPARSGKLTPARTPKEFAG